MADSNVRPLAVVKTPLEPLPAEAVARFDHELAPILKRYPDDRKASAMIPALYIGQEIFGHLSPPVLALAANRLGTSPARAEEVATFYVMLHSRKVGKHVVEICTNVSCCLAGAEHIFEELKRSLGVENGGTTPDGGITFREVECLGCCGTAPAMLVNEYLHEHITLDKAKQIVEGLE
jgi:NADH-quinone oxidoreductase subunit E